MKVLRSLLLATVFLCHSCDNKTRQATEKSIPKGGSASVKAVEEKKLLSKKGEKYSIEIKRIDSIQFRLQQNESGNRQPIIEKITDFETAKKRLKGRVVFSDHDGESHRVVRIRFENGKEKVFDDYYWFVAYYPREAILLCEGGHTSDVSFDLRTGKETKETGNPDYMVTSPNRLFRLNGHYGGQECSSYFIQKKTNTGFQKIIQLDLRFEQQTGLMLCTVGNSFWKDDRTLYLTEESDYTENGLNKRYFKVTLIEK